jgi:hypothetical protein
LALLSLGRRLSEPPKVRFIKSPKENSSTGEAVAGVSTGAPFAVGGALFVLSKFISNSC